MLPPLRMGTVRPPTPLRVGTVCASVAGGMWCVRFITHFRALLLFPSFLLFFPPPPTPPPLLVSVSLGSLDLLPLDPVSVYGTPGTIRKAQNLLKQYSQHGLEGKKGGSILTPLEGNAPLSSLLVSLCLSLSLSVFTFPQETGGATVASRYLFTRWPCCSYRNVNNLHHIT